MLLHKFKNSEEKDKFLELAIKNHIEPLEKFMELNFTTDTVVIIAHDCAKIQNNSYEKFFAETTKLNFS